MQQLLLSYHFLPLDSIDRRLLKSKSKSKPSSIGKYVACLPDTYKTTLCGDTISQKNGSHYRFLLLLFSSKVKDFKTPNDSIPAAKSHATEDETLFCVVAAITV
jgi:hypothetical protein